MHPSSSEDEQVRLRLSLPSQNLRGKSINGSEVFRLSVAIQLAEVVLTLEVRIPHLYAKLLGLCRPCYYAAIVI